MASRKPFRVTGTRLRAVRKAFRVTTSDLAEEMKISMAYLNRIESDDLPLPRFPICTDDEKHRYRGKPEEGNEMTFVDHYIQSLLRLGQVPDVEDIEKIMRANPEHRAWSPKLSNQKRYIRDRRRWARIFREVA